MAPEHWLASKRIVISGAGISGLSFTLALHTLWQSVSSSPPPSLTLYERDPSAVPTGREGYSLSLRSDRPSAGIQALQKLGLLDKLLEVCVTSLGGPDSKKSKEEGQGGFIVWDKNFKRKLKMRSKTPKGCPVAGMRIHRSALRKTLAEAVSALPGVEIKWNTPITGAHNSASGAVEVELKDGGTTTCDLLIAADGSSSKIRTLLRPRDRLQFAGPTCIFGTTSITMHPSPSPAHTKEFGTVISGKGPALFIAPIDQENIVWSLSFYEDDPSMPKKQPLTHEECNAILAEAKQKGKVFGLKFEEMVDGTEERSVAKFNARDKEGFTHSMHYIQEAKFKGLEGMVVFLGDANHAVSPFAGNGANLALMDGWDFAESLVREGALEGAIKRYDKLAIRRAKQIVQLSHFNIRVMHSEGLRLRLYMMLLRIVKLLFFL
ncbi:FAD/NAD(P)-binding domain-containing protein [Lojkania enalia]|uniref:FAD/NAD(P)-binding domain-containing protein n=1 Tax=Lojkania enalia TaxID=147567 RepID=A0A9P4KA63_9PLEO|nr:FAD/NAD(P)-binding domain-containing protein [Didymosphaeria enalia]